MALPLGNLYLHLDTTNPASNPASGPTWFDLTANNGDFSGYDGDFPSFTTEGTVNTLSFTGVQRIINSDNYGDLFTGTVPWTIEIYVKPTSAVTNSFLLSSFPDNEATGWGVKTNGSNGEIVNLVLSIGGGESVGPNISTPENTWVHLVFARDSNSNVRIYKDGVLSTTWNITTSILTPSTLAYTNIGRRTTGGGTFYTGEFGIIRLWDTALTGTQANEAYINAQNTIFPPLYASYDISEISSYPGTGVTLFDLSNSNDVTLTDTPYLPAYSGTGSTKYLQMLVNEGGRSTNYFSTTGVQLTINMWVRVTAYNSGYDCMLTFGPGYPGTYLYLWTNYASQQKYYFEMTNSTPINTGVTPSSTNFDNIIVSITSNTMTAYVNGTNVGSQSHTLGSWPATSYLYLNQADTQGSSRQSEIDLPYLEIYNSGLGSTAAIDLYNSQLNRFVPAPPVPSYSGRLRGRQFNQGLNG